MLEREKFLTVSAEELEGLSYYEIIAGLGFLLFNTQGSKPMDLIAEHASISSPSTVLVLGCGTGGTTIHLAERTGAMVYGIDLLPESVRVARERAAASPAHERLTFAVGDATALTFAADTFDAVITEYVAFFLSPSTFVDFRQILKPGGMIALAEMMKDPLVTEKADSRILAAEASYSNLVGYRFHLPTVDEYLEILARAGFQEVPVRRRFVESGMRETARTLGGWRNVFRLSRAALGLMMSSPVLRKKFLQAGWVKNTLMKNKSTAKSVFQALITGQKSS